MTSPTNHSQLISLGRSIKTLREEQRLDNMQLAERADLQQQRLTAVEEGRADPDYGSLVKLADALGVGVATLVERAKTIEDGQPAISRQLIL